MSNLANYRASLKFNNPALVKKGFSSLYSDLYIVYELNTWPRNPAINFILKNCLLDTIKLVENTMKSTSTRHVML